MRINPEDLIEISLEDNFHYKLVKPKLSDLEFTTLSIVAASSRIDSEYQLFRELRFSELEGLSERSVYNMRKRKFFLYIEELRKKLAIRLNDGPDFHWDYYNSFVIQPMLLDVTQILKDNKQDSKNYYELMLERSKRYAAVQERLISPEGTYPPIGRSLAYRFGAFQLLSKIALIRELPVDVTPQQVRSALYSVIKRQVEMPGTFDKDGWLQIGFAGHQPSVGENYISTGSLYLCSEVFLVLGLPVEDAFWQAPDADWTSKKAWKGEQINIDHAIAD